MTQPLSASLFGQRVKGMMGGSRATKGNDGTGDLTQTSGTTYGGQGLGDYWQLYPGVVGGLTELDPNSLSAGSNLDAVVSLSDGQQAKVGGGAAQAEVPAYGGTAAY